MSPTRCLLSDLSRLDSRRVRLPASDRFEWSRRKNGDVVISHHGRLATTLRGRRADEFVADAGDGDEQELMARLTGNYKRGNGRNSQKHPRNRDRS